MTETQTQSANTEQVQLNIFFTLLQKKLRLVGFSVKWGEFSPVCLQYNIRKVA